jgi:hypothetical protein
MDIFVSGCMSLPHFFFFFTKKKPINLFHKVVSLPVNRLVIDVESLLDIFWQCSGTNNCLHKKA